MTEGKEGIQEVFYGVSLSDVTDEMLSQIRVIYYEIAERTPILTRVIRRDSLIQKLKGSSGADYRMGSKYSDNSKLWVWGAGYLRNELGQPTERVVRFSLDPNMDITDDTQKLELQAKEEQFKKAASDYLLQTGFGIPLEPR